MNPLNMFNKLRKGYIGTVNIGLLSTPVRDFLQIKLIRKFRRKYPKINIKLYYDHVGQIINKLKTDEIDIAFTLSLGLQSVGGLEHKTLWTHPHSIIITYRDHPLADRNKHSYFRINKRFICYVGAREVSGWF